MHHEHPQHDEHLDANLRALAPALRLPDAPDAARMASWKTRAAANPAPSREAAGERSTLGSLGAFIMARKNWFAAAAAVVAVSAAMWPFAGRSEVQAHTIVERLRSTSFDSVRWRLTNVQIDNEFAEGEVHIKFAKPISMKQFLDEDEHLDCVPSAAYAKLHVRSSQGPVPEIDMQVEAAFTPESAWVYGRVDKHAADALREAFPPLGAMLEGGILINFGKLDLDGFFDTAAEMKDGLKEAREEFRKEMGGNDEDSAPAKVERIIRDLLSGTATAESLKELRATLREASIDAKVENQGDGRYLLTSGKFGRVIAAAEKADAKKQAKAKRKGRDGDDDEEVRVRVIVENDAPAGLDAAVLRVMYVEETGIEWLEIAEIGDKRGTIRLDFNDARIDPALLDMNRVIKTGKTSVLNFEALMGLFGEG